MSWIARCDGCGTCADASPGPNVGMGPRSPKPEGSTQWWSRDREGQTLHACSAGCMGVIDGRVRCEVCGWPLADSITDGCRPGNCSQRSP